MNTRSAATQALQQLRSLSSIAGSGRISGWRRTPDPLTFDPFQVRCGADVLQACRIVLAQMKFNPFDVITTIVLAGITHRHRQTPTTLITRLSERLSIKFKHAHLLENYSFRFVSVTARLLACLSPPA